MEPFVWITIVVLGISVSYDIRYRRIPNWLTLPAIFTGIVYHTYTGGTSGLILSITGMLLGFGIFIGFYLVGGMGAGDVKLMAAIGSLLGPKDVLFAALYTAIAGGVYAILLLITQRSNREALCTILLSWQKALYQQDILQIYRKVRARRQHLYATALPSP